MYKVDQKVIRRKRDLNPRHMDYDSIVLTTELFRHSFIKYLFEENFFDFYHVSHYIAVHMAVYSFTYRIQKGFGCFLQTYKSQKIISLKNSVLHNLLVYVKDKTFLETKISRKDST